MKHREIWSDPKAFEKSKPGVRDRITALAQLVKEIARRGYRHTSDPDDAQFWVTNFEADCVQHFVSVGWPQNDMEKKFICSRFTTGFVWNNRQNGMQVWHEGQNEVFTAGRKQAIHNAVQALEACRKTQ